MADLPEFIYRRGSRPKDLALTRHVDWLTGLSFRDSAYGSEYIVLSVSTLVHNGFIVRADGEQPMTQLWTNDPYIEPNSGEQLSFDDGHVSVWHSDKKFWDAWHEADKRTLATPEISTQLSYFALAIVRFVRIQKDK